MINNSFYIRTIIVAGSKVEDAFISFKKGLNVVSGASDTGKSYIYQCIYFMLGGSKRPKSLEKEDTGYEFVVMEIETQLGKKYTIKRSFNESFYYIWNLTAADALKSDNYEIYNLKVSSTGKTISNFYISLIDEKALDFQIKKNARGELQSFTISSLKQYFMVNETKIISEEAVFYNRGFGVSALELSAFRTLLIAKDDKACEEVESSEISKARIQGKLEYLLHSTDKLKERIELISNKLQSSNIVIALKKRDALLIELKEISAMKQEKTKELEDLWHKLNETRTKYLLNNELVKRFHLLEDALNNDHERLGFIEEGTHYFSQLQIVNCPICNSKVDENILIPDGYIASCNAERVKIKKKVNDLALTIAEIVNENSNLEMELQSIEKSAITIESLIKNEINPSIQITNHEIDTYNTYLYDKFEIEHLNAQLTEVTTEYDYYTSLKTSGKSKSEYENTISTEIYKEISKEIEDTLSMWSYEISSPVKYNNEEYDFIINGKSRLSYGKGHRALLYSAFLLSVLKHCLKTSSLTLHPGIVILDSPLTSYKDPDKEDEPDNDRISIETEQLFFNTLKTYKDVQIIIFDNKEPDLKSRSGINFHHFSRSKKQGRYGFFPVK